MEQNLLEIRGLTPVPGELLDENPSLALAWAKRVVTTCLIGKRFEIRCSLAGRKDELHLMLHVAENEELCVEDINAMSIAFSMMPAMFDCLDEMT